MLLHEYLTPIKVFQLAKQINASPAYVRQLSSGFRQPSFKMAMAIEKATNGLVTKEELRPDIYPPKQQDDV